jgi:hypothetical protein|tara:strand:+ start:597 stop:824 length:228 start_codon:yes stop_codon:yes gene_type:complete
MINHQSKPQFTGIGSGVLNRNGSGSGSQQRSTTPKKDALRPAQQNIAKLAHINRQNSIEEFEQQEQQVNDRFSQA